MLLVLSATAEAATTSGWRTYVNDRWGYAIKVPTSLVSQPEPQNGAGLAFFSADGQVKLFTLGEYDDVEQEPASLKEIQNDHEFVWIGSSGRVTYRKTTETFFVSSGISDKGRVFYERYERKITPDNSCHLQFTISYPQKLKATWNPKTEKIAKSWRVPKGDCEL